MSLAFADSITGYDRRLSDAAMSLRRRPDADIPWWAVELLDIAPGDREHMRARAILRRSRPRGYRLWNLAAELVTRAEHTVMGKPIEAWRDLCYNNTNPVTWEAGPIAQLVRDAALYNPRAFVALCDLRDEEEAPIVLKGFHLDMLSAMRQTARPAMIQAFWGGGKSYLSSTVVPLMDWAEWPRATEGRIYLDEDLVKKWTGRLMQIVESNEALHRLFPWIRKPVRGEPGYKIWSYDGFAIAGNPIQQRSFEAHTIGSSKTGFRFMRTGVDDVVSAKEAATASIQERNLLYIKSVALTMRQLVRRPRSVYGTVFPGFYTVGTPYDRGDVNVKLEQEYREKGNKTVRVSIFANHTTEQPRWPERHSPAAIRAMRDDMGTRAFNMRCRLQVGGREHSLFPEADVDFALKDGRSDEQRAAWCVAPVNTKLIIGFDPASGKRPSHHGARYPAYVVYGLRDAVQWRPPLPTSALLRDTGDPQPNSPPQPDLFHHVLQWSRLEGVGFHSQCQLLVDLSRTYNCPVAFEDNTLQGAYAEEIARIASDVKTLSHTTGMNKRDPVQGVEQFEPIIRNRRLVIHAEGAPAENVKALREELVGWPTHAFSDLVMALWIARHQFALHVQVAAPVVSRPYAVPSYVRRFTRPWR